MQLYFAPITGSPVAATRIPTPSQPPLPEQSEQPTSTCSDVPCVVHSHPSSHFCRSYHFSSSLPSYDQIKQTEQAASFPRFTYTTVPDAILIPNCIFLIVKADLLHFTIESTNQTINPSTIARKIHAPMIPRRVTGSRPPDRFPSRNTISSDPRPFPPQPA